MSNYADGQLMPVNIIVTKKNSKPAIEIRSLTTNPHLIKTMLSAAYHNQPIIIMPTFSNLMQSLNSCIQTGILIKDKDENSGEVKYYFSQEFEREL